MAVPRQPARRICLCICLITTAYGLLAEGHVHQHAAQKGSHSSMPSWTGIHVKDSRTCCLEQEVMQLHACRGPCASTCSQEGVPEQG